LGRQILDNALVDYDSDTEVVMKLEILTDEESD
jgi:hypothetical protein